MRADRNFFHIGHNVDLGQSDIGSALALHAVTGGNQIDGAYAAGTTGLGAVFAAGFTQLLGFFAEPLAGEGAFANAGGVSLNNADDLVDAGAGQAGANRSVSCDGVGGGGVGVDTVVQVTQRTQLSFEQDALTLFLSLAQDLAGVADIGLDLLAEISHPGLQIVHGVGLCTVNLLQGQVLPLQNAFQMLPQLFGIEQFAGHNGLLLELIGIEGSDTLTGRTELLILQTGLFQVVQIPVPGQQQGGAVADLQVFGGQGYTLSHNFLHFGPQAFAVQSNAVAQDIDDAITENAGRQQMQSELTLFVDYGVAGVTAALITNHHVKLAGQQVHHTALAFVAPVDTNNRTIGHNIYPPSYFFVQGKPILPSLMLLYHRINYK